MKDTDFDLLCSGAAPEESRRLRKLLAEWVDGDENAFPVQLALLTRAQWRAAATLPTVLAEHREQWSEETTRLQSGMTATTKAVVTEMKVQLSVLQAEVTRQSTAMKDAAATMRTRLAEADTLAREIRETLAGGQRAWDQAKADFDAKRRELEAARYQERQTGEREAWIAFFMFLVVMVLLAIALGWNLGEKSALKAKTPATSAPVQR